MHMAHHPYPYQQAPSQDQYPEAPSQLGKQTTSKAQPTTKAQPKHTHYQTDWQHGYPYGQGSGMFPDYYNNTY
ncbi:hypothetical protein J2S74_000494 [Evansella vedderi]|uniref:Uncharacterized protein n=1 Tax=Evansella vedderi TaxID=38282 RepID=A0ABT9ZQW7_9BACI|nr:hypothetical protein [Evansella vedderi]